MQTQIDPQKSQAYLKTNSLIHLALFMGQLLFTIAVLAIIPQTGIDYENTGDPFTYLVPLIAVICIVLSNYVYRQQINLAIHKLTLKEKLVTYQTALIQRLAFLEGASLFGIVAYMRGGNLFFIIISGILMLYCLSIRPTKNRIVNALHLGYDDKAVF